MVYGRISCERAQGIEIPRNNKRVGSVQSATKKLIALLDRPPEAFRDHREDLQAPPRPGLRTSRAASESPSPGPRRLT